MRAESSERLLVEHQDSCRGCRVKKSSNDSVMRDGPSLMQEDQPSIGFLDVY